MTLLSGVSQTLRAVRRSLFPTGSAEETINFVRFQNPESPTPVGGGGTGSAFREQTELVCLKNGVHGDQQNGGSGDWKVDRSGGQNGGLPPRPPPPVFGAQQRPSMEEEEAPEKKDLINEWQAGWNVTNAIQGMFIVSFPYMVIGGGYWALVAMAVIAYVCCYTGKILVECLYELDQDGNQVRVRDSYVAIAEEVWGARIGGRLVNLAQLVELLMTCILYVLLCGDLLLGSFPESTLSLSSWIVLSSVFLLPCAFLRSLRHVSFLSMWCTVAHMFINGIIIVYCFTRVHQWQFSAVQVKIDIWKFPISLGVVIFSYTSQIFLPSLEGSLTDRKSFVPMMHWTHVAAAIFKVVFAYIGFVTFGYETKEVVTNNLPNRALRICVNLFLVAKALLSYPLPYFAAAQLLENTYFKGRPKTLFPPCWDENQTLRLWAIVLRCLLVVVTLLMAVFVPHFSLLMGLIGSFTGNMLSLVWPCYFHLKIKGATMPLHQKALDIFIILLGIVCALLGIFYSTHALIQAFHGVPLRPYHGRLLQGASSLLSNSTEL